MHRDMFISVHDGGALFGVLIYREPGGAQREGVPLAV